MDVDAIFQQINLTIWMSYMSFCNFNSKSDGHMVFFHFITALPFPLQNLVQSLRSQTPWSVSSTPQRSFGNPLRTFRQTLRALFLKNRDFLCYSEIFLRNTRGPLGCLLGFWPSGPKPWRGNTYCNILVLAHFCQWTFTDFLTFFSKIFLSFCNPNSSTLVS